MFIVTDGGAVPLSSSATLLIRVLITGWPPVFVHDIYKTTVSEGVTIWSTVLQVLAISQITDVNAEISYSLEPNNTFTVNPSLAKSLPYIVWTEKMCHFIFLQQQLWITPNVEVRISITDDNSPQFSVDTYTTSLLENTTVGTGVLTVNATDNDIGNNKVITYTNKLKLKLFIFYLYKWWPRCCQYHNNK